MRIQKVQLLLETICLPGRRAEVRRGPQESVIFTCSRFGQLPVELEVTAEAMDLVPIDTLLDDLEEMHVGELLLTKPLRRLRYTGLHQLIDGGSTRADLADGSNK